MNMHSEMNVSSNTLSPRTAKRRRDAAQRVIAAATRLFADRGFADTPMAVIAAESDVSVGTLYNLFESKEALYHELVRSKAAIFRERLSSAANGPGAPHERLETFLREKLAVFREEAGFIRLYYQVNAHARLSLRVSLPEEIRQMYDEGIDQLARVLEQGVADGSFSLAVDCYRAAVCFHAVTTELFLLHVDDPSTHPADVVLEEARRLIYPCVVGPPNQS